MSLAHVPGAIAAASAAITDVPESGAAGNGQIPDDKLTPAMLTWGGGHGLEAARAADVMKPPARPVDAKRKFLRFIWKISMLEGMAICGSERHWIVAEPMLDGSLVMPLVFNVMTSK
jgi:hypothetical protein